MKDWIQLEGELIRQAIEIRARAYAPYSNYAVGAAILAEGGQIFCGCNVENSSYGLTVCAERNAVAAMIAAGDKQIMAIAIALKGNGSPCGACRQVLSEFGNRFPVLIVDVNKSEIVRRHKFDELLPMAFQLPDRSIN